MFLIFLTDHAGRKITEFSKELSQMHDKNVHMNNKLEIEAHFLLFLKKNPLFNNITAKRLLLL